MHKKISKSTNDLFLLSVTFFDSLALCSKPHEIKSADCLFGIRKDISIYTALF